MRLRGRSSSVGVLREMMHEIQIQAVAHHGEAEREVEALLELVDVIDHRVAVHVELLRHIARVALGAEVFPEQADEISPWERSSSSKIRTML